MDGKGITTENGNMGSCMGEEEPKERDVMSEKKDEKIAARLSEVVKYMKTLRAAQHLDLALPSMTEVYPRLFVGNRLAATNLELLQSQGISHLLNAAHPGPENCMTVDCSRIQQSGIIYLGLQLSDDSTEDIRAVFSQAGRWIAESLGASDNEEEGTGKPSKVLINCWAGISRSATLAIAFLMEHRNLDLKQAIRQVKLARDVSPNRGFLEQLVQFERELGRV